MGDVADIKIEIILHPKFESSLENIYIYILGKWGFSVSPVVLYVRSFLSLGSTSNAAFERVFDVCALDLEDRISMGNLH